MSTPSKPFFDLTAADLMCREVISIPLGVPLTDAAKRLSQHRLHGAPVIDVDGQCVGFLSISDLARWIANRESPPPSLPRACQYQEKLRELGGETTLCLMPLGTCNLQQEHLKTDGKSVVACGSPHSIPVDWQVVEMENLPEADVQHYMTSVAATASVDSPITALAKQMTDSRIHRIVVVDAQKRPIGLVSSSDIVAAVAGENRVAESSEMATSRIAKPSEVITSRVAVSNEMTNNWVVE